MKKTLIWILLAGISGIILGRLTFDKYENLTVENTIKLDDGVYMLKYGIYDSFDLMINDMSSIERFVYIKENEKYKAYIAISKSMDNINKIKKIYDNKNYNLEIEQVNIDNNEFILNLDEYEKLLDACEDEKSILIVVNQILSCYEKLVSNDE